MEKRNMTLEQKIEYYFNKDVSLIINRDVEWNATKSRTDITLAEKNDWLKNYDVRYDESRLQVGAIRIELYRERRFKDENANNHRDGRDNYSSNFE